MTTSMWLLELTPSTCLDEPEVLKCSLDQIRLFDYLVIPQIFTFFFIKNHINVPMKAKKALAACELVLAKEEF